VADCDGQAQLQLLCRDFWEPGGRLEIFYGRRIGNENITRGKWGREQEEIGLGEYLPSMQTSPLDLPL